jgi:hypothetical protein
MSFRSRSEHFEVQKTLQGINIKAAQGKRHGAVFAKKGQFASYKEKLEKWTEFHYL